MQDPLEWLEKRKALLEQKVMLLLRSNLQSDRLRSRCASLPLQDFSMGIFAQAESSFQQALSYLEDLEGLDIPLQISFSKTWKQQRQQFLEWNEILLASKEQFLQYEELLLALENVEKELQENWECCPTEFVERLVSTDETDILEQVRLNYLMAIEDDADEAHPEHNPFFAAQVRQKARESYLGLSLELPLIRSTHEQGKAEEELAFQLEWLSKIPMMLQTCTEEEISLLAVPNIPYRRDELYLFLEQYRALVDKRKKTYFSRIFRKKYVLDSELLSIHNIATRLVEGQPFVEMVYVDAGRYRLESLGGKPYVQKTPFWISIVPVTQGLYRFFHPKPNWNPEDAQLPMTNITWYWALAFCNYLSELDGFTPCYRLGIGPEQVQYNSLANGYRLPTEYEWEAAAQPGMHNRFQRKWRDYLWCRENTNQMMEVAQKKPNQLCLYDMLGNIWEWCYTEYVVEEPTKEEPKSSYCTVRGGSWRCSMEEFSTGMREGRLVERGFADVGFRLVRNATDS